MKSYIKKPAFLISLFIATVVITSCSNRACEISVFGFRIINSYPHDTLAFTEGLSFYNGYIVEGTGIPGYSSLRKYQLKTGDMIDFYSVPDKYFAEGITIFNKKVAQITEDANVGFIYDLNDFNLIDSFVYNSRGWGITWDGKDLIMSDGSEKLYFSN